MSEEVQFTCGECGKQFDPDPDAMVEWNIAPVWVREEDAEEGIPPEELKEMQECDLKAIGITPEQRDALLRGETIAMGGCVCRECMEEMVQQQDEGESE